MTCQDCNRPFTEVIDFLVATPIWNFVMSKEFGSTTTYTIREGLFDKTLYPRAEGLLGVVCLVCFDKRARDLNIPYSDSLVVFGIDCWMGGARGGANIQMPLVGKEKRTRADIINLDENQIRLKDWE